MVDAIFNDPRLAEVYDPLDPDRRDLDAYVAMVDEFAANSVLDIGCGTGTFACMLARRGVKVVGLDPARASLRVARGKSGAELVRWVHGEATDAPLLRVDTAFMTGNVAQVFLTDADWAASLAAAHRCIRRGGRLVFETRDPAYGAWHEWTGEHTLRSARVADVGEVVAWQELVEVVGELVTFESHFWFISDEDDDGELALSATSTLRFRSRAAIEASLDAAGFADVEVREAPDRPGRELVFVATRR